MLERDEICLSKERLESKIIPKLRADGVGVMGGSFRSVSVGLVIFESCCERPIRRNSDLEALRVRELAVIPEDISETVD